MSLAVDVKVWASASLRKEFSPDKANWSYMFGVDCLPHNAPTFLMNIAPYYTWYSDCLWPYSFRTSHVPPYFGDCYMYGVALFRNLYALNRDSE